MRKINAAFGGAFVAAFVFACLALFTAVPLLRAQPADEGPAAGPKWEYARLVVQSDSCAIETADITRTAASTKELYEKAFGGRGTKPFKNDSTLLTRIGGNGWELTSTYATDAVKPTAVYVFKRAVK